ncbi:class I SAM-dependent methyltransferase [Ferrimonas lipolytica]|uniref:Class I SAM-dependent methyltransferase n=1 Tax=Ferrimonas lipolytica TaxID=2724191 RepID=A0A6H1UCT4_9GAMM|nr:class I SAM-dependent methyltransferase [Ferrimonas lipolytica]QIZ76917.1 class I SAM-dependent methyltransferase [Ferrimonas lipolytica]
MVIHDQSEQVLLQLNQQAWDRRTQIHIKSRFYDVDGFLAGKCQLNPLELQLIGSVRGKSMLHLQCHFGLDSLNWCRRGAWVTGVDFSPVAIEQAQHLAKQSRLAGHFICADVLSFANETQPEFDWVYTSYGVLCWLADIDRWAHTVASALKPGGKLCLIEFHPALDLLQGYGYFNRAKPDIEVETTYTENAGSEKQRVAVWCHSIGEVQSALLKQGMQIEHFQEYDYSPYDCFDNLVERQPGQFVWERDGHSTPLLYSLVASKK